MGNEVIIVEDDEDNAKLMKKILESAGYQIQAFSEGDSALKYCSDHTPDLILMDITLPGKDGMEVSQEIHKLDACKQVPIVIISAHSSTDVREKADALGLGFLPKPYTPDTLKTLVSSKVK